MSSLEDESVEINSRLNDPSRVFLPFAFFVASDGASEEEISFLFGVVFGGANGCWGETDPGFWVTIGWVTIFRGLPRGAFFSLSLDLDPLEVKT